MKHIFLLTLLIALFSRAASAQENLTVQGLIKDDEGEILVGATIAQKGAPNGTFADANGAFTITVPANSTLVFSYTGLETQEIEVDGRSQIDVVLKGSTLLKEVVIGYTTQKKKDLTGAVSVRRAGAIFNIKAWLIRTTTDESGRNMQATRSSQTQKKFAISATQK